MTGPNAFELAHSEPLLPHPTLLNPKPTTTCANPITNLSFSPRRVDILAVASNDGSAGITGGKVVAVQGPGSVSYDKATEEAWLKEMEDGMKGKGRKVESPKVEIWNTSSTFLFPSPLDLILTLPLRTPNHYHNPPRPHPRLPRLPPLRQATRHRMLRQPRTQRLRRLCLATRRRRSRGRPRIRRFRSSDGTCQA